MPFGVMFKNGQNVTVIDEETSAATFRLPTWNYFQEGPGSTNYHFNPTLLQYGIPLMQVGTNVISIYNMPTSDTGGQQYGISTALDINNSNGLPDAYPLKFMTSFENMGASNATYGMRVYGSNGSINYDSGRNMALPFRSIDINRGQQITLPNNFWYCPTAMYQHWTGQWRIGGGISRVSEGATTSVWQGNLKAVGTGTPATGTRVGHFFVFENGI